MSIPNYSVEQLIKSSHHIIESLYFFLKEKDLHLVYKHDYSHQSFGYDDDSSMLHIAYHRSLSEQDVFDLVINFSAHRCPPNSAKLYITNNVSKEKHMVILSFLLSNFKDDIEKYIVKEHIIPSYTEHYEFIDILTFCTKDSILDVDLCKKFLSTMSKYRAQEVWSSFDIEKFELFFNHLTNKSCKDDLLNDMIELVNDLKFFDKCEYKIFSTLYRLFNQNHSIINFYLNKFPQFTHFLNGKNGILENFFDEKREKIVAICIDNKNLICMISNKYQYELIIANYFKAFKQNSVLQNMGIKSIDYFVFSETIKLYLTLDIKSCLDQKAILFILQSSLHNISSDESLIKKSLEHSILKWQINKDAHITINKKKTKI